MRETLSPVRGARWNGERQESERAGQRQECRVSDDTSLGQRLQMVAMNFAEVRAAGVRIAQRRMALLRADLVVVVLPGKRTRSHAGDRMIEEHQPGRRERSEALGGDGVVFAMAHPVNDAGGAHAEGNDERDDQDSGNHGRGGNAHRIAPRRDHDQTEGGSGESNDRRQRLAGD